MIVFPIVATAISAVFATVLFLRWSARRRFAHLAWGIAMAMFAVASAMLVLGVASEWDATMYRAFWLFGVMLNVPWLAVGSVALVAPKAVRVAATVLTAGLSIYAVVLVTGAEPDRAALARVDGVPRGTVVWAPGEQAQTIGRWYSILAWLVVLGIALWTSRARRGVKPPRERVRANVLIAAGVTIVAIGGFALARIGGDAGVGGFSVALAAGVTVMFWGFLLASRAPRYRVEEPGESPT